MCGFTNCRLTVLVTFVSIVVVYGPRNIVSADSDHPSRSQAAYPRSTDRPPPAEDDELPRVVDDQPEFVVTSGCSDYENTEVNDRYYIRELICTSGNSVLHPGSSSSPGNCLLHPGTA